VVGPKPVAEAAQAPAPVHAVERLVLVAGREPHVQGVVGEVAHPVRQAPGPRAARTGRALRVVEVVEEHRGKVHPHGVAVLHREAHGLVDAAVRRPRSPTWILRLSLCAVVPEGRAVTHLGVVVHRPDEAVGHRPPSGHHLSRQARCGIEEVRCPVQQSVLPILVLRHAQIDESCDETRRAHIEERWIAFPSCMNLVRGLDRVLLQ